MKDLEPSNEVFELKRGHGPIKGRGSATYLPHRFTVHQHVETDDGWWQEPLETDAPRPATRVIEERVKSLITHNDSPDIPFSASINPYRGCEHGCIYCYARPTHSYLNLSPGLDFESQIVAKVNAVEVLQRELAHPKYQPKAIMLGAATDAYQPVERELQLTRGIIEVLTSSHQAFSLITKSSAIERDLDLLLPAAQANCFRAAISLTTLDPALARLLEPRAAAPARRLRTIKTLTEAGFSVTVGVAPLIPFINQEELEKILVAAHEAGARAAFYTVVRLPWEVAPLFKDWLALHFPERAQRVMVRIQDLHGGQDYRADFGLRRTGAGLWADLIRQRFRKTCARLGLNQIDLRMDESQFRRPTVVPACQAKSGAAQAQLF